MKNLLLILLLSMVSVVVFGQKVYYYGQLDATRLEDGRMQYKDQSENKPLKGECKVIENYRNKDTYFLTNYKNGFKDGKDVGYKRGRLESECFYKEGKREGTLKEFHSDGSVKREATFKNGKLEGRDIYYYTDGSIEKELNYKDGVQHGKEISYEFKTREIRNERNFFEGKPDGVQKELIFSNVGNYKKISTYDKGVLKDQKEYHHPEGKLKKERDGGKEKIYRKDGTLEAERNYVGDDLEGEQKTYYANGKIERVSTYKNNYKHGPLKEYFPDGKLRLEENYVEGARNGAAVEYYSNGKKSSEWNYDGFERTGPYKIYYDDGTLNEEGEAKGDYYVYRKIYYKNGKLKSYWMVSNGVFKEIERYDEDGKQK